MDCCGRTIRPAPAKRIFSRKNEKRRDSDMKRKAILGAVFMLFAALPMFASNEATNTNTVSSTLQVNVTVVKAIRLTLSQGTQCTINSGSNPDFSMNFGTVDALGISAGNCGAKYTPPVPGT